MNIKTATKSKHVYIVIILLAIICFVSFGRIAGNEFINFDDNKYVTENNHIKSGFNPQNIQWAATAVVVGNWHPLTLFSHMLDWRLFGTNPAGHHLVSLLFHIGAVIFLFLFLHKTTCNIWASAFAAILFAVHPLRVESVAWVAERKDVLSMFFGMACIYIYVFYARQGKAYFYVLCLILFMLALLSKPMMVTLPFVLLLLDYWPLGRWPQPADMAREEKIKHTRKLVLEKIPFIVLSIFFGVMTYGTHSQGSVVTSSVHASFFTRCANAAISYATYMGKTLWPAKLAIYYPYDFHFPLWQILISVVILVWISLTVLYYIKKFPFLFVGWFWYLGTLLPVIGLIQFGTQAMADRYTYLPSVGLGIMLSWGIPLLFSRATVSKIILLPSGLIFIVFLVMITWQQSGYWQNSITLFSRTLQITKNNYIAHNHLAYALFKKRSFDEAIYHYHQAVTINPVYAHAYYNRGIMHYTRGDKLRALDDFRQASRLIPKIADYASVYNNMGVIYTDLGQYQSAIDHYNEAIRLDPDYIDALNNRAYAYLKAGDKSSGCRDAYHVCKRGSCQTWISFTHSGLCH